MVTKFDIFLKNFRRRIIRLNITLNMRLRYIYRVLGIK